MGDNASKWTWIIAAVVVVVAALGLWWIEASQSGGTALSGFFGYSNTATSSTTTSSSGVPSGKPSSSSVVAVAESISGASDFGSWLASTGVGAQLSGKGPYTIFVPTDGSISQLPAGTIANLSAAGLKRYVEYHIVVGRAINTTAQVAGTIQAMSGDALNFHFNADKIPMVDSGIIIQEFKASNGVVYLVSNPLLPPKKS
ncbi:MAG TPA: fasciclin domain-containing protein [Candidatus Paceibacterota bacterium]|nr:fasciclin domain-containing protein [Candidatus Paceibacterota bacterium]